MRNSVASVHCSLHARCMPVACSLHARCMLVAVAENLRSRQCGRCLRLHTGTKCSSHSNAHPQQNATFQPPFSHLSAISPADENGARLGMSDKHSPKRHGRRHSKCPHLVRPGRPFVAVYCAAFPPGELAVAAPPRVRRERSRPTSPSRREEIHPSTKIKE